jgi:hypothetical protein
MNIDARGGHANYGKTLCARLPKVPGIFLCVLLVLFNTNLFAQAITDDQLLADPLQPESPNDQVVVTVVLPDSYQMAMALVTPAMRQQALLDLAVAANVYTKATSGVAIVGDLEINHVELAKAFLDDRARLQVLVDRYGWVQPRNSVLDPAAWLVLEELQQHDLEDVSLVIPGRTPRVVLSNLVFQRVAERVSVSNLPGLLLEVEADAIGIWNRFYQLTGAETSADAAWKEVELGWFTDRQFPPPLDPEQVVESEQLLIEQVTEAMSRLVLTAVDVGPPDSRGLQALRYSLLTYKSDPVEAEKTSFRNKIRDSLYLASLIDGLHEGRYFDFVQGLLSISYRLLEHSVSSLEVPPLVTWLVTKLPSISAHYAVDFARVDPRLNAALSATFEVMLKISSSVEAAALEDSLAQTETMATDSEISDISLDDVPEAQALNEEPIVSELELNEPLEIQIDARTVANKESMAILADAVAQLALMIPDMGYYFDTPVRRRIVEEIDICISIAASRDDNGGRAMVRRQFDACMETLLQLAETETRMAELSGNINGPFTTDTLRRELNVTPWQRINYGIGYLHDRYSSSCQPPSEALPNPLEWAVIATTMTWFAEKSPEFVNTPENEARVTKMRDIGEQLIMELAAQTECLAGTGSSISDPVSRGMNEYELALRELNQGIRNAEADFRTEKLSPDADVLLDQDATQATSYRPEGLVIEPCDKQTVCDMSASISTTRALIGLFPDEYLVAEQTGLGNIEICYRNMEWVERRSELVRPDDENVSNYYGRLGFDLVGRYGENDKLNDIFAFRFTSPGEYHYLFAQTSEEVLNDSCPMSWVGTKVVTPLRKDRGGIVPNRLTYLAASRMLPSRLLQSNWDRGAEWRDWFVTGIGVSPMEVPVVAEIMLPLDHHLQSLYQAEQAGIYQRVLLPSSRNAEGEDVSLFDEMLQVSIAKALIRMQMILFYPESLFNSDRIRTSIAGDAGLLDARTLRRFREENLPLTSVNAIALERLTKLREVWSEQSEAVRRKGTIPASLMQAMTRIHILYRQVFTARPEPLQEVEVTAKLKGQQPAETQE